MNLKVSEIFYSLQGEGARAGTPTIFIRLQGCKAKHACASIGIKCDTEFESGKEMSLTQIHNWIKKNANGCKEITWTGGEPLPQLTSDIIMWFIEKQYFNAVETSGLFSTHNLFSYITVSPKVAEHIVKKNFDHVQELRYVRHAGQSIPQPSITAHNYYISPHSDGYNINSKNLKHCIDLCLKHPKWKLSVQQHKLWNIL